MKKECRRLGPALLFFCLFFVQSYFVSGLLIASSKYLPGLNFTVVLQGIMVGVPVLGLRAKRSFCVYGFSVPKPINTTSSWFDKDSVAMQV